MSTTKLVTSPRMFNRSRLLTMADFPPNRFVGDDDPEGRLSDSLAPPAPESPWGERVTFAALVLSLMLGTAGGTVAVVELAHHHAARAAGGAK